MYIYHKYFYRKYIHGDVHFNMDYNSVDQYDWQHLGYVFTEITDRLPSVLYEYTSC